MKIIIATDTWMPSVNGVVRTLTNTKLELEKQNHEVQIIEPSLFNNFSLPLYPDVKIAYYINSNLIKNIINKANAIHIATEGPIGYKIRRYCLKHNLPYTTSYHTNFADYLNKFAYIPHSLTYWYLRKFHKNSKKLFVTTQNIKNKLIKLCFKAPIIVWSRGVDTTLFHPIQKDNKKIALYVGRISVEKNIEDFLKTTGFEQHVVGDGPYLNKLKIQYPNAKYFGALHGKNLAEAYANADVFVFPSKTDTFGNVMLEALASGLPVAAYPVNGPIDIITNNQGTGHLSGNLQEAMEIAYQTKNALNCVNLAKSFSWEDCTNRFLNNLEII